jgi:hypothetical protein
MDRQGVITGFDMLLEEMDHIVVGLNEEGADLFSEGKYDEAKALIAKVKTIIDFRDRIQKMEDEWETLSVQEDVSATSQKARKKKKRKSSSSTHLSPGLKTPKEAYRLPILMALVQMNGSGRVRDILPRVREMMKDCFNDYDFEPLPSNPDIPRWDNTAQWERYFMVEDGLLASDSPRGVWEITEKGRKVLAQSGVDLDDPKTLFSRD